MEKPMRNKTRDPIGIEIGECLLKMPAATAEQLNIANILSKPGEETDLRSYVAQLQELTACTEDQAVTALYDCENNLERAVELLLDKLRFGTDEEWYTTGKKVSRTKHNLGSDSESFKREPSLGIESEHDASDEVGFNHLEQRKGQLANITPKPKNEASEDHSRKRNTRVTGGSRPTVNTEKCDFRGRSPVMGPLEPRSRLPGSEAWDPYTEYGEWAGEAIEVVNSNASISRGLHDDVALSEEVLVDTESHEMKCVETNGLVSHNRSSPQPVIENNEHNVCALSPKSRDLEDVDTLFITKARSKPPPPAFTNFPDVPAFIVPELLPRSVYKWPIKICGELSNSFRTGATQHVPSVSLSSEEVTNGSQQCTALGTPKGRTEIESQELPKLMSTPPKNKSNLDATKSSSRSLLEASPTSDSKQDIGSANFRTTHFQNANANQKSSGSFPQKPQATATYVSEGTPGQSSFLDSSLKNYILDNLPSEMNKLSVSESSHTTKSSQYNLQTTAQAQAPATFSHNQGGSNSITHPVNKMQLPHISPQNSTQHVSVSSTSQSQQQTAPVPPVPHFIGQFAPPAYMFNLPGNSGNTPTIFDIDQFQLLQQQQRMLFDMHLQQQAATTAQSLLTSTADASTSGKSTTHSLAGNVSHVNPPNPGIRPDMLTSAMGHAPQLMPAGHSYFSYPGFVVMNGYSNAFLNQQQQQQASGQDGSQNPGSAGHGNSSVTHQQQSTNPNQSYSNMKSVNSNVTSYDDLFEMKYGDPAKQVGFKNTPNTSYPPFQGHIPSTEIMGSKLSSAPHSNSGVIPQGFTTNSGAGQPFSPQFYSSAPYLTAAAVAVAAAAAASAQHQQQVSHSGGNNQPNSNGPSGTQGGGSGGPNPLHQPSGANQAMTLGSANSNLHPHHHQRSVMPQQF